MQEHAERSTVALVVAIEVLQHPFEEFINIVLGWIGASVDHGAAVALSVGPCNHGVHPNAWQCSIWTGTDLTVLHRLIVQCIRPHGRIGKPLRWPRAVVKQTQIFGSHKSVVARYLQERQTHTAHTLRINLGEPLKDLQLIAELALNCLHIRLAPVVGTIAMGHRVQGNLVSGIVKGIHSHIVRVFVREKEGAASWAAIGIGYITEEQLVLGIVHGIDGIIKGYGNELKVA